ncbi:hypothetical protein [Ruegeria atlantica]|uniref:Uncharacterized protein n=1 Tax=Ruegeria atlantica TaxID=81569 RepID=A0A0P1ESH4_9RHOB|nr:hypothetical protein [Ruegeria atlantica]CUH46393.1 hypothetical protein RUA4292_00558 [Ruegeria atlantica]
MTLSLGQGKIAIGRHAAQNLGMEACIQMLERIQAAVDEPIMLNGTSVYMSRSIESCLRSTLPDVAFAEWIDATGAALAEAQRNGPATIRAFSSETQRRARVRANLRNEFIAALDSGEIRP